MFSPKSNPGHGEKRVGEDSDAGGPATGSAGSRYQLAPGSEIQRRAKYVQDWPDSPALPAPGNLNHPFPPSYCDDTLTRSVPC